MNPFYCRVFAILALLSIANFQQVVGQISTGELPYSWSDTKTNFDPVHSIRLPEFDVEALRSEDEIFDHQKDVPLRFAHLHEGNVDLTSVGTWQTLANGSRLLRIEFESEDAYSMNFTFSQFYLPEGSKLWAYSSDQEMFRGAFTTENNHESGVMALGIVSGDKVTIEYLEPQNSADQPLLVLSHVAHDYRNIYELARGFDDSGNCNNDVICPEGDSWRDQISSVALITTQFGSRICTGALVNNVNQDGTPYFLTADHCLGSGVTSWVFYFNYDSPTCSPSSDGPLGQSISGCVLRASNGGSDVALLELNNTPPASFNIYYSGWDRSGNFPSSQVGIHHPSGDVKKITFDEDPATQANWNGAATWRIATWEDGTTEPGSSGSPLFDQNQRIIGQLYGGTASCSNNIDDYYGRFDVSWDGPNASSRLRDWLDPSNTIVLLDGYNPNESQLAFDVGITAVFSPSGTSCGNVFVPQVQLSNIGTTTLNSVTIFYQVDGGTAVSYPWSGTLTQGTSETVSLPEITVTGDGAHTFTAYTSNPNGQIDENTGNDATSSNFNSSETAVDLQLLFTTDNYPEENYWELLDDANNVVESGGPYSNQVETYDVNFCVPMGCYTFVVYDSYGDGMQYQGVVGDYSLSVVDGDELATMVSGGNFGAEATHSFCLTGGCTDPLALNFDEEANVDNGSCFYAPLLADFSATPLIITAGQSVSFTNQSSGVVEQYNWSFPGGAPSNSTQENPVVVFDNEGLVDVTLQVSGPAGSDTEVKIAYINVLPPTQNCVTAFPFIDNFDNLSPGSTNLNTDWEQLTSDDFDWLVGSGATPSENTGPSNDHTTGAAAGRYLYTEASDPNFPAKSAVLVSPCIDISSISSNNPYVSFYYHMYGGSMGQLRVDLFANGDWIDDFFVVSGNQGNQWLHANLSLQGYSGVIQLRFRATTGSGNQGWQSDLAIDDFMVYEFVAIPGCTDPAANNYNPAANQNDGSCEYGCAANEDLLQIVIVEDNYPDETTWELRDETNTLVESGTTNSSEICVEEDNCYTFTIFDSYGDGICCGYGNGSYTLLLNGIQIAAGGDFTFDESVQFNCAPGSTCSDAFPVSEGLHTAPQSDTWYLYTPAENGQYKISTCSQGNTCDTKIFLYDYCAGLVWDDTNAGTIAYNDDFCGVQSEITPFLQGGVTYYLRIGDDEGSCGSSNINFEISFMGGISGCMDPLACNYSPLASEAGPCYYNDDSNCDNLGPDLDILPDVFYDSMYLTTISATQNNNYTCLIDEGCVGGYGTREIVRFTTHIKNIGNQDYYIGSPSSQAGQFEWDPCHGHWHYEGYAEYVLYDENGEEMPYIGFKNGFCVLDLECSDGGTAKFTCGNMGITAGCGDYYSSSLACQWLDLTDVPAGNYTMVVKVNWDQSPDALGRYELRYDNNWAHVCISFDRDANGDIINFTKSQGDCVIVEDCVGQPFGNSQPDCEANCPGFVVTGDINNSGELDVVDVQEYLTGILGNDIPVSACTDVNMTGDITVADAAILSNCSIYGEEEIIFGGVHNHCIFGPEVINPDHTTTLSIGDVNFEENYIDIYVQNPNNEIVGYQFNMSGVVITGVENLISPQQYPVTPQFLFGSNQIISLSLLDSTINKNVNPTPMLRITYSALTAQEICIDEIVDIVNEHTESVLTVAGPCFETSFNEPVADFEFDAGEVCEGGEVSFTDMSLNQPTSWLWSFPGGTPSSSTLQNPTISYNAPGVYNVSLTASNEYGYDVHLTINGVLVHGNPVLSATASPVQCNGGATGAINLNVSGGQTPFSFTWSNGFDQEDPTGLAAGSYNVTVTDFNGCFASISALVTQPSPLQLTEISNNPSSCGAADGMAIVEATGGASNYSYTWQPGNLSGAAQSALTPDTYTVTVTDGNLCATSIDVEVGSSGVLDCFNDCNGSAFIDDCDNCIGGNTGLEPCVICDPGFFVDNGTCTLCPPGTFCPGDGNSYPCSAGTYQSAAGATVCLDCEAGSFSATLGATSCQSCPGGTFQAETGATDCVNCPAGTANNQLGQTECVDCPAGSFSAVEGAEECALCPAQTYSNVSGSSECIDCEAGSVSDPGATECIPCAAGTYELNGECTPCPPGAFCPGDGNSYPCPVGTFSSTSGAIACQGCPAGTANNQLGQIACPECPAGSFSPVNGAAECILCPADTYSGVSGSSVCLDCEEGSSSDPGSTECTPIACALDLNYSSTMATPGFANGSATVTASGGQEPYAFQWNDPFMQTTSTAVGLFPGTYTCEVTDANDCTDQIQVYVGIYTGIPTTQLTDAHCNMSGYSLGDMVSADFVSGAEAFRWEFVEQGGDPLPEYTRNQANPHILLHWVSGLGLGTTYEVRVKVRINGEWGEYGETCTLTTVSDVPLTEVLPTHTPDNSMGEPYLMCDVTTAYTINNATNYEWEFDNGVDVIETFQRGAANPSLKLSWVDCLQPNTTYQVRVRAELDGQWGDFGNSRPIEVGPTATTQLRGNYCGTTFQMNNWLLPTNVCISDSYEWELVNTATNEPHTITTVNAVGAARPAWAVPALIPGAEYSVRVKAFQCGVEGVFGAACNITIAGPEAEGNYMPAVRELTERRTTLFPNPNSGAEVRMEVEGLDEGQHEIVVLVYDIYGQLIQTERFGHAGSAFSQLVRFDDELAMGMYMVHVLIDGEQFAVERMVVK